MTNETTMTNENDKGNREQSLEAKTVEQSALGCALALQIAACVGLFFGPFIAAKMRDYARRELAEKAAMTIYEPVGNGGALAAMNHHISPEKRLMYERMEQIRKDYLQH